ncbi:MAG: hypothetical protein WA705_12100 [Candidatus Ozemobacteraceae bacterium]
MKGRASADQRQPPFWRINYPGRQIRFSGFHMSPDNLCSYVGELHRRRLPWIHGYPSHLALLAGHLLDKGRDLGYQPKWVTTGSENLLPHQIGLIEKAFGCRPRQHYGISEGVVNFSECECGRLHVDEDYAAVEFIPQPDGPGMKIVGVNFTNQTTPHIQRLLEENPFATQRGKASSGKGTAVKSPGKLPICRGADANSPGCSLSTANVLEGVVVFGNHLNLTDAELRTHLKRCMHDGSCLPVRRAVIPCLGETAGNTGKNRNRIQPSAAHHRYQ